MHLKPGCWYFVLFFLCHSLLASHALAADKVLDASQLDQAPVSLTEYFAVLEDPGPRLTLSHVREASTASRFQGNQAPASALSYGFTTSAWWLRLNLRNSSAQAVKRVLEINNFALTSVEFYQPDSNGTYQSIKTGDALPFATRAWPNRFFVFPITLPAHAQQTYYLRIQANDGVLLPIRLWTPAAFHTYERVDYLSQFWYFGMARAMILFNLLMFIAMREAIYLFYVAFIFSLSMALATYGGLAHEFLWPDATLWSDISYFVGWSMVLASALQFTRIMLNTAGMVPRVDRLIQILTVIFLLSPIPFALSMHTFAMAAALLNLFAAMLILGVGLYCAIKRQRSAYFFLAAFSIALIGAAMTVLRGIGLLPSNMVTINALQFGSALEMILLAFALADRFNIIRREKAEAEQATLLAQNQTLLAQSQLIQSEKMAALGQLIASVTHEINTPISAIKSSGVNISTALSEALIEWPKLFQALDAASVERFSSLIQRANLPAKVLSTREERALVRELTRQLDEAGVENARQKADILVQLNAHGTLAETLPLLRHAQCELIFKAAHSTAKIISSTGNVNSAVERVAKLIVALKSFSRVDKTSTMMQANLQESLESVLTIHHGQIKYGIELVQHYQEIPPILCLPDELNQVWTNLIYNALQAMNQKGTLTISISRVADNALVSIGDTGCGIPEAIRSKIFEVFFTTKAVGEGSGLGLSIAHKIIDKHGGRIEVQSEVGVGTTFSVYLPYNPSIDQDSASALNSDSKPNSAN